MSAYTVQFTTASARAFRKLDPGARGPLSEAISALESDPRPNGVKKLRGADDLWRIRVGNYRVVYQIDDGQLLVLILRTGHRRDIYDGL